MAISKISAEQIREIERIKNELAKAEAMKRLGGTYMSDWDLATAQATTNTTRRRDLIDMVRDRWEMSMAAKYPTVNVGRLCPAVYCHSTGEKVFVVVVSPSSCELIEDEACIFPSDALMARLHLAASHGNK